MSKRKVKQTNEGSQKKIKTGESEAEICPICRVAPRGEVQMSCRGMHSYCFTCILNMAKETGKIKCPECRKECSHVVIPKRTKSMEHFLWGIGVIPDPRHHDVNCECYENFDNTSIYPEWVFINYMINLKQLKMYKDLIEKCDYTKDDARKLIRWKGAKKVMNKPRRTNSQPQNGMGIRIMGPMPPPAALMNMLNNLSEP